MTVSPLDRNRKNKPLPVAVQDKDELIAKAIADRGMSRALFDCIKYNWGEAAAIVALLTGEPQKHEPPSGVCGCS